MRHRGTQLWLACCALLLRAWLPALAQEGEQTAGPGLPTLRLLELTTEPPQGGPAGAPGTDAFEKALYDWWGAHAASGLRLAGPLQDAEAGAGLPEPAVRASIRRAAGGCLVEASLLDPGGAPAESRTRVFSSEPRVVAAALGGEILGLWVRSRGYPEPEYAPPRLAALLELSVLPLPAQGPGPAGEPLGCEAGPHGPVLLFSDRTLELGPRFELTPGSVRDLALRERFPEGLIPSHLAVDPWGEPIVYAEGSVLRYPPDGLTAEQTPVGPLGAQDAAGLGGGGIAVLSPGRVWLLRRADRGLRTAAIPLPSPFYVALAAGPGGALWLYDLEERKIRQAACPDPSAEDPSFEEIGSIRPLVSPQDLPFPQLLRTFPDGGFVMGGAGELWRFDAAGWPLWRLQDFEAGVRQSLPAFYRIAVEGERALYLLDPLSRRLLRFVDFDEGLQRAAGGAEGAGAVPRFADPPEAADVELAGLLRRWSEGGGAASLREREPGSGELAALLEACRARGLLLMARSVLTGETPVLTGETPAAAGGAAATGEPPALSGEPPGARGSGVPDRELELAQAAVLVELAAGYEERLLLAEAEKSYNAALRILRALRARDPVDPELPVRIRELERRRNGAREILVAVPSLELEDPVLSPPPVGGREGPTLRLPLRSLTGTAMRDVRFQVAIPGLTGGLLTGELPRLAARATTTLTATLAAAPTAEREAPVGEDLPTRVLVLVTATVGGEERTFRLEASLLVQAGGQTRARPL
ncbi:MAG: hypothetical protein JW820_04870 [Spirochaetales bacterium]|nr:hypothetical protein [Spirochaetales bacterium]